MRGKENRRTRLTRHYLDAFPTSEFVLTAAEVESRQQHNISCISIRPRIVQNPNIATMETAKLGKISLIWLKAFGALRWWFFRRIHIEVDHKRAVETQKGSCDPV